MNLVKIEKKDRVAILTLNRPEALNALNSELMADIDAGIDEITADPAIKVMIITGSGKSFIAGADIAEMKTLSAVETLDWAQKGGNLNNKIEDLKIPVIAAVNGFALGGGCELAMCCDIRLASEKAKFGQPETGLGVTPGAGGTQRLPRIIGEGRAKELLYTAKTIDAREAERIGLVNHVYAPEDLMDEALKMANAIADNAPVAVQECKKVVNAGMQADIKTGLALELQAFSICGGTEDKQIGMGAFLAKSKEKKFEGK